MDTKKSNELKEKYNHLLSPYFWGFETSKGWDWIVEKYLEKTQFDVEKNRLELRIIQIKEKFASLRIYTDIYNDTNGLDDRNIAYCEALADYACEKCGCLTKDKQYTVGWIVGLCPECFKEHQNENQQRGCKEQF